MPYFPIIARASGFDYAPRGFQNLGVLHEFGHRSAQL